MTTELETLRGQAQSLAAAGDWSETAVAINSRMLEIDDRAADAYTRPARCFLEQGRLRSALEMYSQVLTFEPGNSIARNRGSELESNTGRLSDLRGIDAISTFGEAFAVGLAAGRDRRFAAAVAALSRAVELSPESVKAWNALGAACRHLGDRERAREAYRRALSIEETIVSMVGLAALARDDGQLADAEGMYRSVLKLSPGNSFALNGLGGVLVDGGRLQEAEECFTRVLNTPQGRIGAIRNLEELVVRYQATHDRTSAERLRARLSTLASRLS